MHKTLRSAVGVLVAMLVLASCAAAQTSINILVGGAGQSLIDNAYYYAPGTYEKTAFTIPAGKSLLGFGPGAVTINSAASVASGRLVSSANFGSGGAAHGPVAGLKIFSADVVPNFPYGDATETAAFGAGSFQETGVSVDTRSGVIEGNWIEGFRNYGAEIQHTGSTTLSMRIRDNMITRCWHGIKLQTDAFATGNTIANFLENGIVLNGGAISLSDNHVFGGKRGLRNLISSIAIRSTNDRFEDAEWGIDLDINCNEASFVNTSLYNNFHRGARIAGTTVRFISPRVVVPTSSPGGGVWPDKVGIEFTSTGHSNEVISGNFNLSNTVQSGHGTATASTALRVAGNNCRVDTTIYDQDGINGSRGLHIPSQIRGGEFTYRIYGFEGAGDAALDIDANTITGCTILILGNSIRSPGFDYTDAAQYVDIPAGWDNTNTIIVRDEALHSEASPAQTVLTPGTGY